MLDDFQKNKKSNKRNHEEGFSLIELLIVSVILLFVLGIMATIVSGVQSSYSTFRDRSAKHNEALASMNLITRVIRNAGNNTTQIPLVATGNNRLQVISDWTPTDNATDDPFENVEFYVSNNSLFMVNSGSSPNTFEIAQNIQSINFVYFDANGVNTSNMPDVAMVRVMMTIAGESQPLISNISIRGRIQPK